MEVLGSSPPHPMPSTDRTTTIRWPPPFLIVGNPMVVSVSPSQARPDAQSRRRCVCTSQLAPSSSYHHGLAPNTPNATGQHRAMTSVLAQPRQRFPLSSSSSQPRPPPFSGFVSLCIPVSPLFTHPDEFRVHRNYTYILQCLLAHTLAPACNPAILLVLFIFNIYPNILNV